MTKGAGLKKPNVQLPPRRGLVKIRIFNLIIEFVKKKVTGLREDNMNVVSEEEVDSKQLS